MTSPGGKLCLVAESDWLEAHHAKYGFRTIAPANAFSGAIMALDAGRPLRIRTSDGWRFVT